MKGSGAMSISFYKTNETMKIIQKRVYNQMPCRSNSIRLKHFYDNMLNLKSNKLMFPTAVMFTDNGQF